MWKEILKNKLITTPVTDVNIKKVPKKKKHESCCEKAKAQFDSLAASHNNAYSSHFISVAPDMERYDNRDSAFLSQWLSEDIDLPTDCAYLFHYLTGAAWATKFRSGNIFGKRGHTPNSELSRYWKEMNDKLDLIIDTWVDCEDAKNSQGLARTLAYKWEDFGPLREPHGYKF